MLNQSRNPEKVEKYFRKKLLRGCTKAEKRLMILLDDEEINYKFQKIVPIAPFRSRIVDFYFKKAKLMVEIDGGYHNNQRQQKEDLAREFELRGVRKGWVILRFTNDDVFKRGQEVVEKIKRYL